MHEDLAQDLHVKIDHSLLLQKPLPTLPPINFHTPKDQHQLSDTEQVDIFCHQT